MKLISLVCITFNVVLQYKFACANYLASEANLLDVLTTYIDEREVYLEKLTRYLDVIEKSYNTTKNTVCAASSNDSLKNLWYQYLMFKRITVDWKNFLNVLNNDTNITDQIIKAVTMKNGGIYADWTIEKNDYKLIHFVQNLINMPYKLPAEPKTQTKNLRTQFKAQMTLKIKKFKETLKTFMNDTGFQPASRLTYWDDYRRLCRGEILLDQSEMNLKCKYVHDNKPYLLIGPFKQEEVHSDPQILVYHDVLSDNEIKEIQKLSIKQEMSISQDKETLYRVAKVSWLHRKTMSHVFRRVELMTNLNMTSAEDFQVAVYGLAGHYAPHYDSSGDKRHPASARISTLLFYLNDVTKGGATAFPKLKLAVAPRKGSVVFWYNIKGDYEVDSRTLHGGCPLYSGLKWVMNSWVKHTGQEFRKPCVSGPNKSFIYQT